MDKRTILHILFLLFLSAALLYLTKSWLMSLGILMLLLLIDSFLLQYDNKRRREWEERKSLEKEQELESKESESQQE